MNLIILIINLFLIIKHNKMKNKLEIQKFNNPLFGTLSTLTNKNTGVIMFIAKEVGEMWKHTNIRKVINEILDKDEINIVQLSKYPKFKKQLSSNFLIGGRSSSIMLISESGLYKLAAASTLPEAKMFRNWIFKEVIPNIFRTGSYSLNDIPKKQYALEQHLNREIQVQNSKDVNAFNYEKDHSTNDIINYNRKLCFNITGMQPNQVRRLGKSMGLKSKQYSSSKEVMRTINKPLACSMSFIDNLVINGIDFEKASEIARKNATELFENMIAVGITPKELTN